MGGLRTKVGMWNNFLHAGVLPSEQPLYEQIYVINSYLFLAFLSLGVFGLLQLVTEGDVLVGNLELAGSGVIALIMIWLRLTRHIVLARVGFLLTVLTMLAVMLLTGGTHGTGIFWFFMFPVIAFFVAGKRQGIWWMVGLFSMVGLMVGLSQLDSIGLAYPLVAIRQLIISVLVITIGIYVYQQSRESLEQQKAASQQALDAEKIRAETIIQNLNEAVVAVDSQGNVKLFNRSAEELFGLHTAEAGGKRFVDLVSALDNRGQPLALEDRPLQRALAHPTHAIYQVTYIRKDRSTFPAAVSVRSLMVGDKIIGAVATLRNIAEELAVERAKTEFVTLASHQLRTPISAIGWFSEMLLHGDAGKLSSEQYEYIQQVYTSNQRLATIVEAMLTVATLELGDLAIKPQHVNVPELSRELLHKELGRLTQPKELHIQENYDDSLTDVQFDPTVIKTILQNLISNAIKYTPNEGTVTITLQRQTQKARELFIEVSDTGVGVPKKEQPKLFTKFFRAGNVREKDTDGTGLGLYIVKTIAEYVGGSVGFSEVKKQGSCFSATLPLPAHLKTRLAKK